MALFGCPFQIGPFPISSVCVPMFWTPSRLLLLLLLDAHLAMPRFNEKNVPSSVSLPPSVQSTSFLRFLQFSVWAPSNGWLRSSNSSRVLAIIESFAAEEMKLMGDQQLDREIKPWQIVLWLFTNSPEQRIPFVALVNVDKQIQLESITDCGRNTELEEKRMEVEIEVSIDRMFVRAKNAVRYLIPHSMDNNEMRVYFIRNDQSTGQLCQLKSEMEFRGTSKFAVPPTAPPVVPPPPASSTPFSPSSQQILPSIVRIDHKWPYSRKRPKIPRRSTTSARQRPSITSPLAAAPPDHRKAQLLKSVSFEVKRPAAGEAMETSTAASYIDILRDRQLFKEVQRSRTEEINSRWSATFLVFMLLVAFLISITAAFALLVSLLLQWRPKSPKPCRPTIATIVRR